MKKGDEITIVVKTPMGSTEETAIVEKINENMVFVEGLETPFYLDTGQKTESFTGSSVYIKELINNR